MSTSTLDRLFPWMRWIAPGIIGADPDRLRQEMVRQLVEDGAIRSDEWRRAFERVPRHVFVPRFEYEDVWYTSRKRVPWLRTAYRKDAALVVQADPANPIVRASSSGPGIMAKMLELLELQPGQRVLEVGTGTGYNAALLSDRMGDANVTTIDVSHELVTAASEHLAEAGYHPTVVQGDGWNGWAPNAPYDRLIATCRVHTVPPAWIAQVRPGGRIVGVMPLATFVLDVREDGSAEGRFPIGAVFMPIQGHSPRVPTQEEEYAALSWEPAGGVYTEPDFSQIAAEPAASGFWFFEGRVIPHVHDFRFPGITGYMDLADGSWVRQDGEKLVQGGPRRLLDERLDLHRRWCELGRPARTDFRLTVEPDGSQWISLTSGHRWELSDPAQRPSAQATNWPDAGRRPGSRRRAQD
jgi:protein-L-isoaspartate(D-aspartate) O-methyltransferase